MSSQEPDDDATNDSPSQRPQRPPNIGSPSPRPEEAETHATTANAPDQTSQAQTASAAGNGPQAYHIPEGPLTPAPASTLTRQPNRRLPPPGLVRRLIQQEPRNIHLIAE
jgi:hypothetical protein